jgi:conjugal transfer ATP-binding protein TraC
MPQGTVFRVGSFDLTRYAEGELWAKMGQLARFYAALPALTGGSGSSDFRLLAYSRPYPLDEPLERIKAMMASAQDPRAREQIAAYRRFLEQIIQSAYLKDTDYYLVLFSERKRSPESVANLLAAGLHLPVQPVTRLPSLIQSTYQEAPAHIRPLRQAQPYLAFLYSYDLRGQLSFGTVASFLALACPLSLAVDVRTVHPNKAVRTLQMAHNKLKADLLGRNGNEAPDPEKEQAYLDVQAALHAVQHERHGLHQVVLAVAVEGRSRDELERNVEMVTSTAARNQVYLRPAWLHQFEALRLFSAEPTPESIAREARNLLSPGVALLSPFGYEVPKNTAGPFVAINRATGSPLWLDKFALPAYNEVVLGRTGSGKTFMAGLRAYRERMFGVQTVFLDPQGNFRRVTEAVGGRYNFLRLGEGTALNILDVVHDHAAAQVSHVVVLLESLLGRSLSIGEKAVVDRALLDLYHSRRVRTDDFRPEQMPKLEDLATALKGDAPHLVADLERFVSGSLAGVFNAHTTLSLDLDRRYPIVTFDLSDLEGEFQPTFLFALLSSVERVIRQRRGEQQPTNVVIDEFGVLSEIPALAQAAGLLAKRVRAWKVGIQCLDQNWSTFDTPAGRRILENALVKVVMRVDETAAPAIVDNLGLTGHHAEVILSAGVGEGVLIVESKPYHVFFQASPTEVEMLTPYATRR